MHLPVPRESLQLEQGRCRPDGYPHERQEAWLAWRGSESANMCPRGDAVRHRGGSADQEGGKAYSGERAQPRSEAVPPGFAGEPRLTNLSALVTVLHTKFGDKDDAQ